MYLSRFGFFAKKDVLAKDSAHLHQQQLEWEAFILQQKILAHMEKQALLRLKLKLRKQKGRKRTPLRYSLKLFEQNPAAKKEKTHIMHPEIKSNLFKNRLFDIVEHHLDGSLSEDENAGIRLR